MADVRGTSDDEGRSPLYVAAMNNCDRVTKFLIEEGALINLQDKKGCSPLLRAALNNSKKIVAILIEHGALVNLKDKEGNSPSNILK